MSGFDTIVIMLLLAVLMDMFLGEPRRWHPLVGFGYLANTYEKVVNHASMSSYWRFIMGVTGWLLLVLALTGLLILCIRYIELWLGIGPWLDIVVLYLAIGFTSLKQHAYVVWQALVDNNLALARQ